MFQTTNQQDGSENIISNPPRYRLDRGKTIPYTTHTLRMVYTYLWWSSRWFGIVLPTSNGTCLIIAYKWDLKLRLETMNALWNFVLSVSVGDTPKEQYIQGEHDMKSYDYLWELGVANFGTFSRWESHGNPCWLGTCRWIKNTTSSDTKRNETQ